ncbi:MAG: beta-glucosidase BglX [Prolixibacteraceae bacterium]|jgi:beta-glucosidase|nr:beta-glucosidase BglX [Prolixibacteraceae bacterium]
MKQNNIKLPLIKHFFTLLFVMLIGMSSCKPVIIKEDLRIENLLKQMTLKEKVSQLNLITALDDNNNELDVIDKIKNGEVGHILKSNGAQNNLELQKIAINQSRLGIPIMFHEDVIHGYKTIFPSPMGEASSWNLEMIEKTAHIAAIEAAASGIQLTYAPMVDVTHDARWGRIVEGAGEDPWLGSEIAAARVRGFQGKDLSDSSTIMACAKHFIGYGNALAGIDYNIGEFSERMLRETYLPPFKSAIDEGVGSVMVAYSAYNGVPASANKWLINQLLREELGFDGMVISDWGTISNLIKSGNAINENDAAQQAIEAGVDLDMVSEIYVHQIEQLIRDGSVDIELINMAVRRVLKAKFDLGLFDNPYVYFDTIREKEVVLCEDHLLIARQAARESMVLLKNNNLLPLSKEIKTIAVIGPLANRKKDMMSWWGANHSQGNENDVVTLLEGIKSAVSKQTKVFYSEGVILNGFEKSGINLIDEAVAVARKADVVVLAVGEEYWMSGEGASVSEITLPGSQNELIQALARINKPVVAVLINGRPYDIRTPVAEFDAVLEAWQPGTMAGHAISDLLFGDYNPSGKLPVSYPYNGGQIPIFYNQKRSSHDFEGVNLTDRYKNNYLDITTKPLFSFGFGLSYSKFEFSNLRLEKDTIGMNETTKIFVDVQNISDRAGEEVVQLYIQDMVSSAIRPAKELKDFSRISLKSGELKTVVLDINPEKLKFYNSEMNYVLEPGYFSIMVGNSSQNEDLLVKTLHVK